MTPTKSAFDGIIRYYHDEEYKCMFDDPEGPYVRVDDVLDRLKALTANTWQTMYEDERDKFQQETRRTSELNVMLRKILKRLHDMGCRAEEWNKKCATCDLMIEAEALLNRPINIPPKPEQPPC